MEEQEHGFRCPEQSCWHWENPKEGICYCLNCENEREMQDRPRLLILFRCRVPSCPTEGRPQDALLAKEFLKQACEPDGEGIFCIRCGQSTRLSDSEKANTRKMLAEETESSVAH
jgi:hypothetical protein